MAKKGRSSQSKSKPALRAVPSPGRNSAGPTHTEEQPTKAPSGDDTDNDATLRMDSLPTSLPPLVLELKSRWACLPRIDTNPAPPKAASDGSDHQRLTAQRNPHTALHRTVR